MSPREQQRRGSVLRAGVGRVLGSTTLLVLSLLSLTTLSCGGRPGQAPSAPSVEAAGDRQDERAAERQVMVRSQIEARGIEDPRVLAAMRAVRRHLFVPQAWAEQAYQDHPLPIAAGQTISQPYIVALMSELLEVEDSHTVLEIGTGSGYQAAVLARLAARVLSIEIVEELGIEASRRLEELGYGNVEVRIGNGYLGWPERAPFERIILTAAPETIPPTLIEQLAAGGRLVAPEGPAGGMQYLVLIRKTAAGEIRRSRVLPVRFVPMVGESPAQAPR